MPINVIYTMFSTDKAKESLKKMKDLIDDEYGMVDRGLHNKYYREVMKAVEKVDQLQYQQKHGIVFGHKIEDIRKIMLLLKHNHFTEENISKVLFDYEKAYKRGFDDCSKTYQEALAKMRLGE